MFLGDADRARKLLDRCLVMNPAPQDVFFNDLALISIIQGDFELAASYLELTASPHVWGNLYSLLCAELSGQDIVEKRDIFLRQARHVWPEDLEMTTDAIVKWIEMHHPFQDPTVEGLFFNSARRALLVP